ncbi:uncharacterized protein B0P05DRAFT_585676 [Gilbertella persicaria]|uniref:uncharacterized protein n=1 Tax=Gilbertella persicaria TaxID=101096 RepID=UPI00221F8103|nr:uncharacterized protein B0P05DRAFT_585676 [Gilbertella persicaria]KAI8084384.1 hypothetical protein B0P05DRAFT_585676 [Gilbertella persicaria]
MNFQAIKKRTHEEMTDDEECDKDENEEDDGYEGENDNNKDDVNELLLRQESNLDHLNRLSISILKNWVDNDEVLGQILRISLSGIIDLAHDWTSQYCKSVFPDARWSEFEKLSYPIYDLTQESNEIYTNVMRKLKSEDQKSDHERQPEHEALIYLSEKKHEYRKKKLDCEELQIIEILDTL